MDISDAHLLISGSQRYAEEHLALLRLTLERRVPLFLFNELDVCLASTNLQLTEKAASQITNLIGEISSLYEGPFSAECKDALDCFCYSVDKTDIYQGASIIPLLEVSTTLGDWQVNQISFLGFRDCQTISIDNDDEGAIFERAIWASMESVFPMTLYKNPKVKSFNKTRELTDVIAFYEYGSFLIEAKDLKMFQGKYKRDQERRLKNVQNQIKKAIAQLNGASKALKRGDPVYDLDGEELYIIRDQPPHCIVLITELMHWGDWSVVESQLIDSIHSSGAFFQVMDLREFISLLKASSDKAHLLDYHLINRFKEFVKNPSVHIRSRISSS